ncbi:MAG: hypothetical protein WAX67_02455 [Rugosibacter sp.]
MNDLDQGHHDVGWQVAQLLARKIHAAYHMGFGELRAGTMGLLMSHQVASIMHQRTEQRCIDMLVIQSSTGQMQAVQHARRTQHHLIGMHAVVIWRFELFIAGQITGKSLVKQHESAVDPSQVMTRGKFMHNFINTGLHLASVMDIAQRSKWTTHLTYLIAP